MKSFGKKVKFNISRRDYIMITILIIIVELYFLFYRVLWTRYDLLLEHRAENTRKEHTISVLKADYDKTDDYKAQLESLLETEKETKLKLPAYASQEELILLIDSLSKDTKLTVIVASFQGTVKTQESDYIVGGSKAADATSGTGNSSGTSAVTKPTGLVVADQSMSLSFNGTFDSAYSFLDKLEKNERPAYVSSLSLSTDNKGKVSGSMQVDFLSLIDTANPESFKMQLDPIVGKTSPFIPYAGFHSSTAGIEDAKEPAVLTPDFALYINSYLDNAPGIIITDYKNASARISTQVNRLTSCIITFNKEDKGYNYSFELDGKTLESSAPIQVKNGEIVIEVISQTRKDNEDLTAASLDVVNNTNWPVHVVVSKDDDKNPRFSLGDTRGNVTKE